MNTGIDWNLLRSMLAVVEHGSLLGAARVLGLSQPTVGRQVADLESQFGVVLFERTGRGLLPTKTALRLAELARPMEQAAAEVNLAALGSGKVSERSVKLAASQPIACYVLPPILAHLRLLQPQLHVDLAVSNDVSNLLRREADIALRMVEPRQVDLIAKRIGEMRLGAYAHASYLRRRGTPRQPKDLLSHDVIGRETKADLIEGFARHGILVGRDFFALRTDDLMAYWQAVRCGVGIGFVADYLARMDPEVVPVLPDLKIPPLPLWVVVHRELRSNRSIRKIFDFLSKEVPKVL